MTMNMDPAGAEIIGTTFAQLNKEHGDEAGATLVLLDLIRSNYINMLRDGIPESVADQAANFALIALQRLAQHTVSDELMAEIMEKLGHIYRMVEGRDATNGETTEEKEASNG